MTRVSVLPCICSGIATGLFLFLDRPDVDATNYRAEQAIRPAVINRKTSGGNRTPRGARAQAVLMSIQRTAKLRSVSALDAFKQMLRDPTPRVHHLGRQTDTV